MLHILSRIANGRVETAVRREGSLSGSTSAEGIEGAVAEFNHACDGAKRKPLANEFYEIDCSFVLKVGYFNCDALSFTSKNRRVGGVGFYASGQPAGILKAS